MGKIELKVKDIVTSYGKFKVEGVTFSLQGGDILGLVGRSGSGKSTIIKTLIGLKHANEGSIKVLDDGKPGEFSKYIGYSPQENSLYPLLTLEENLIIFGRLHGIKRKEIKNKASDLLKRLDLQGQGKKRITELSGGMKKRADLAVTLITDPKIIVMDEPFTGLDIAIQNFIWKLLKDLAKEGKIVIISSHMLADIQKHCNHFGLVYEGSYYDTKNIFDSLKKSKTGSLEKYLEKIFGYELRKCEQSH